MLTGLDEIRLGLRMSVPVTTISPEACVVSAVASELACSVIVVVVAGAVVCAVAGAATMVDRLRSVEARSLWRVNFFIIVYPLFHAPDCPSPC
ncbi:hypothetical protein AB5I41_23155 [Sphingomonas sp. MMS24-JH45]